MRCRVHLPTTLIRFSPAGLSGWAGGPQTFHWEDISAVGENQKVIYLEADNVSCAKCGESLCRAQHLTWTPVPTDLPMAWTPTPVPADLPKSLC